MFVLVSSNAETLFKRGILDVLCYPAGEMRTFRYQSKYVDTRIRNALSSDDTPGLLDLHGRRVLIVYAQCPGVEHGSSEYQYCAIRFATIAQIRRQGDIIFVDVELADFVNIDTYEPAPTRQLDRIIRSRPNALNPQSRQGIFFDIVDLRTWTPRSRERRDGEFWESVVRQLAMLPSMRDCLFFRVVGLYRLVSQTSTTDSQDGVALPLVQARGVPAYIVPMGAAIQLRLLFFRPETAPRKTIRASVLVKADPSGFSEVPTGNLRLESRYDELRVTLTSRRLFDSVLAPISVSVLADNEEQTDKVERVLASYPVLMCIIQIPKGLALILISALLLGPFLLALESSEWACVGAMSPLVQKAIHLNPANCDVNGTIAMIGKFFGGIIAAAAGWFVFRRFPTS